MPKYYGCPCEGCGKPLTLRDDIVVCPDCGAPYHRDCYEKLGRCIHSPAHAADYEWKFPYQESELCTCPSCGERTLRSEEHCRCCGAKLTSSGNEYCSDACRRRGEEMWRRERIRRKLANANPISRIIKETEEYNRAHGTDYTYGEYVAYILPGVGEK